MTARNQYKVFQNPNSDLKAIIYSPDENRFQSKAFFDEPNLESKVGEAAKFAVTIAEMCCYAERRAYLAKWSGFLNQFSIESGQ